MGLIKAIIAVLLVFIILAYLTEKLIVAIVYRCVKKQLEKSNKEEN